MNTDFAVFQLDQALERGLHQQGLHTPTPVQSAVLPAVLAGQDLLVRAATGSGKTLAFLLPLMHRFLRQPAPDRGTRALILAPTRELAQQIEDHFLAVGRFTRLRIATLIGGAALGRQVAWLRRNPDFLVATPGRLLEHLTRGSADLSELEALVLDEADRMLDLGLAAEVLQILGFCNPARQSLLLSATLEHRGLEPVMAASLRRPQTLLLDHPRTPHPNLRHQRVLADSPAHKQAMLAALLADLPAAKVLVFVNTRERTADLVPFLIAQGQRAAALHGELEARERLRVLGLLRQDRIRVLVATDLAARGLDVPGMDAIVHFDIPRNGRDYLHRSGRSGRAGAEGRVLSLVGPPEWNRMESIVRYLNLTQETCVVPGLEAVFRGAKAGKGAKKRPPAEHRPPPSVKAKHRHRDRKNLGKRRKPTASGPGTEAGFDPLRKKAPR